MKGIRYSRSSSGWPLAMLIVLVSLGGSVSSAGAHRSGADAYNQLVADFNRRDAQALWNSLPYRYQRDVKVILRRIPTLVDRDTYHRSMRLIHRFSRAAPGKKPYVMNVLRVLSPAGAKNLQGRRYAAMVTFLRELSRSELADYDKLRDANLDRFMRQSGPTLMRAILKLAGSRGHKFDKLVRKSRARMRNRYAGRDRVEIHFYPRQRKPYRKLAEFKRVDGRWVTTEFSRRWSAGIRDTHSKISKLRSNRNSGLYYFKRKLPVLEHYVRRFEKISSERELLSLQFEMIIALTDSKGLFDFSKPR